MECFNGDFAKLTPRNYLARHLFTKTHAYMVESDDTFHLQFVEQNPRNGQKIHEEPVESSTEYDSNAASDSELLAANDAGHFILSFHPDRLPEGPSIGWKAGRGMSKAPRHRGIDFLLTRPGDNLGKSLASVHLIFRFNPTSGFLMLKAGSSKAPIECCLGDEWERLDFNEERIIYRPSMKIRAGLCEYEFEYTVAERHQAAYFNERDGFLHAVTEATRKGPREFDTLLQTLPRSGLVIRGRYVEIESRGSGAFGWIVKGVNTRTGNLVAIKEIRIEPRKNFKVMAEVNMGQRITGEPGLLPTLDSICEHGHAAVCSELERFYIIMPFAYFDLTKDIWGKNIFPLAVKLHWLKDLLTGLRTLHGMGIMHRDITRRNMLIISYQPPRAAICDYGKAVAAQTSSQTTIGPIYSCAPEVWAVRENGAYSAKIDLWAWGLAMAEVLGVHIRFNCRITHDRHVEILKALDAHAASETEDRLLVDLLQKLLIWEPEIRWSAEQALKHPCWLPVIEHDAKEGKRPLKDITADDLGAKRALLGSSSPRERGTIERGNIQLRSSSPWLGPSGRHPMISRTQEISQETWAIVREQEHEEDVAPHKSPIGQKH